MCGGDGGPVNELYINIEYTLCSMILFTNDDIYISQNKNKHNI